MKVLVISDIHGNLAALEAVAAAEQQYDSIVCLGDIVGYGPEPGRCTAWIHERANLVVQGNHDHALANDVAPRASPQFRWLADATAGLGRDLVSLGDRAWLTGLPHWAFISFDRVKVMCVHATPIDPLYEYVGPDPQTWARVAASIRADLILAGHTHLQFDLTLADKRVVNPGSVGQPKDGDPRAAYAIIEDGRVRLARVPYDIDRTVSALEASTVSSAAVAQLSAVLRTGQPAPARAAITDVPPKGERRPRSGSEHH